MNILQYTRQEPNPINGGIERVAQNLAAAFRQDSHLVYFLYGDCVPESITAFVRENNIDLVLNHEANDLARTTVLYQALRPLRTPLISILHFDPKHCTDCFHTSFIDLMHSGLSLREKIYFLSRNTALYRFLYRRYFGRSYARIYNMSDAVVLLSERFVVDYQRMTGITDTSRLYSIPNLLASEPYYSPDCNNTHHTVLYVARLTYLEKRPDLMLRVWQKVATQFPDWRLVVIGDGSYRPIMEQRVIDQHIPNVCFVGKTDATPYYQSADILCSTSNNEGFPLVLTEAAAHGIVPICFDSIGSARDIISDGDTGYIIPSYDVVQYAERLAHLMEQFSLRHQMATSARAYVNSTFSRQQIMPLWYDLIQKHLKTNV